MRRLPTVGLVALMAGAGMAIVPPPARAQEAGCALDPPPHAADPVDPSGDEQVALGLPRSEPSRSGWATFGGQAGFFTGTAITAAVIAAALEDPSLRPYAGMAGLVSTAGLTVLLAWRTSIWAEAGDWDPTVGWGFAGLFPGASAGIVAAAGTLMAIDPSPPLATRLTALGAGALLGGAAGYLAFHAMAESRSNAGWETFAFWVGFFLSEVCALATIAGGDASDRQTGLALAGIPVGAALSTTVVHLLLR